jgi:DEAD/DEAH box helicase domain-containing protein
VDRAAAPGRVHEGAVYLHEGRSYLVARLDWENGLAEVQPAELDYFTEASEAVEVEVVEVKDAQEQLPSAETGANYAWGALLLTSQAAVYRKVKRYTHEHLGYGEINLPAREFQTTGYWLWFPEAVVAQLASEGLLIAPNDYGPNWDGQRAAARVRDGYRCRQCGRAETDRQHDVHHLIPFRSFGYVRGLNEHYLQANALENLLTLCRNCHLRTEQTRGTQTALGGLANALGNVAPLFLMCDPRDLGLLSEQRSKETGLPTITIYDRVPEGLGFADRLFELRAELLHGARELIRTCPCREGCPACVGPVGIEATDAKPLSLRLAERLV